MPKTNWYITGPGGQGVVEFGGSKRCQLSGSKLMLWNGRSNLANSELVAEIYTGSSSNSRAGLVLRSDLTSSNAYMLRIFGTRTYYLSKIVAGLVTTLATVASGQPWNTFVKTRFRVDGYQLSVEEWIGGVWQLVSVVLDTELSLAMGYAGIYGESVNTSYSMMFDNVEVSERV